jgi:uncharacterized protein YggT (Ycf19 family)
MDLIVYVIYLIATVYIWLIIARALLSWFPIRPGTIVYSIYSVIYGITEPYLGLFRRYLPIPRMGAVGIDLSAIVGLIVLFVLVQFLGRI